MRRAAELVRARIETRVADVVARGSRPIVAIIAPSVTREERESRRRRGEI